jgi:hypothetical protein
MSTSGTYNFSPDVAELTSEAWERLGFEPETLKARHAKSTRRSLNFMFSEWTAMGFKQPWITTQSITLTQGQNIVPLLSPAVDVFHTYLTRSGYDVEMYPMSETEWEAIPNKLQQGRPTMYWVRYNTSNANGQPEVVIWQASQNSTDIINLACFNRAQDVGQANNGLFIPYMWLEAVVADLAARLAVKWRPERAQSLAMAAWGPPQANKKGGAFGTAMSSTREKSSTKFRARFLQVH